MAKLFVNVYFLEAAHTVSFFLSPCVELFWGCAVCCVIERHFHVAAMTY